MKKETFIDILLEVRELLRNQKEILNLNEFCSYTGYEKSYIYKLTSKRKIPHYKTPGGNSIFFRKSEIDEWLTAIKVKTLEEIKTEANNQKPKKI
ncbi:hypothetical protein ATE47_15310 [Chryseobacterium sp. IHB B 17019]|uniref:helix-turn-helix transcriptional regulator n=1 Tax=Chryseobacterium sp. IHB B 17019 TaxID=1721091 RepID=UPI000720185E|nr:helix-turn-helix domain-containing protein [Chryseobacterium sp. IHB B 17019]ALR31795.1 hypothetical protein ATE47_15310 [Chryseobacterium sp. IHB B 17019]